MMTTAAAEASTLDRTDPRVRKLVYNMYRNVLGNYNDKANAMLDALPEHQVTKDQGINRQLSSILHQIGANDLVAGDMSAPLSPLNYSGGTQSVHPPPPPPMPPMPPPPPPMVISGSIPAIRIKTELNEPREIPSTIQNAMATKDKKPFTYLPGGLDLSEIKSPRMQRRLERNAQTPPSPEQVPQKSPDYQQQQEVKINFEQKPACNVRSAAERPCLLPQVQHQPQLNKSPTPWMQKAAQIQPNPAPWTQNKKEYIDQVDKSEERIVPARVEINRQIPSQPLKNNINHLYDSEPIQGRSFKVLQKITEPKGGTQGVHPPPPPPPMVISGSIPATGIQTVVDKSEERVVPARVEINRQTPSQPLKNNINHLYDSEPLQGRSFKVLQKITEPKGSERSYE